MDKEPQTLYPADPLPELYISPMMIFVGCAIFAIVFWSVGTVFKYYIGVGI